MRDVLKHSLAASLFLALPMAFATAVNAQEFPEPEPEEAYIEACTAEAVPGEIAPGQAAVQVTFNLSEDVGVVTGIDAPEESGLAIAAAEDLPRDELAAEEEAPRPIEMSLEGNSVTLWLNTAGAEAGTYDVALQGTQGHCSGSVTVGQPF